MDKILKDLKISFVDNNSDDNEKTEIEETVDLRNLDSGSSYDLKAGSAIKGYTIQKGAMFYATADDEVAPIYDEVRLIGSNSSVKPIVSDFRATTIEDLCMTSLIQNRGVDRFKFDANL